MESRTHRYPPGLRDAATGPTTYRAEICRRDTPGRASKYYDGGDFSPYCIESLVELLRSKTRAPYESMGLTLEIRGRCSLATMQELAHRFAEIDAPNVHVNIRAPGHPTLTVDSAATTRSGGLRSATGRRRG